MLNNKWCHKSLTLIVCDIYSYNYVNWDVFGLLLTTSVFCRYVNISDMLYGYE